MSAAPSTTTSYLGKNPSPQAFAKYAKKHDIFLHPDVAFLVPTKTMGMGVFAARPLATGTVVISCPEASGVSPYMKDVATSPAVAALHASAAAMEDAVLFDVLVLMSELCRAHSLWRPWLETCPRMDHHLFDLTAAQAAALGVASPVAEVVESSAVAAAAAAGAATVGDANVVGLASLTGIAQSLAELRVASRWAAARAIMAAAPPTVWPEEKATLSLFCDCLAQVFSRNFHREELPGREGPYLLPGLDILNHSFTANTTFEVRGGGRKHATAFTVVTTRPVQKGEQVYGCYGRIGAARFAVEFQFVTKAVLRNDLVRCSAASLATLATLTHYVRKAAAADATNFVSVVEQYVAETSSGSSSSSADEQSRTNGVTAAWKTELFGGDSPAVVSAIHKEMQRRVEQLQRLGLLYDEGLYLVRPYATWAAEETAEGVASFRWSAPGEHEKEVAHHARLLSATVYLLTAPKADYDDLYHRISVEWEAPQTPATARAVRIFLAVKMVAAARQEAALDAVFTDGDRDAVRRQLVRDTLAAEVATLRYYADTVG